MIKSKIVVSTMGNLQVRQITLDYFGFTSASDTTSSSSSSIAVTVEPAAAAAQPDNFPLSGDQITAIVIAAFEHIPQIYAEFMENHGISLEDGAVIGMLLQKLIANELERVFPGQWAKGVKFCDKDIICLNNPLHSFEIKTSSSAGGIWGNKLYGRGSAGVKDRNGWLLAVNYDIPTQDYAGTVRLIRLGLVCDQDWDCGGINDRGQGSRLTKGWMDSNMTVVYSKGRRRRRDSVR